MLRFAQHAGEASFDLKGLFVIIANLLLRNQVNCETDLSTFQTQAKIEARFFAPHAELCGPGDFETQAEEGPETTYPSLTTLERRMAKPPASFSKAERLRSSSEFRAVLTKGKSIRENGIALYYTRGVLEANSRLGILVAKRVVKRAVGRNKIKRTAREYFRRAKRHFHAPFDVVVRAVAYDNLLIGSELQNILSRLFERAGLLEGNHE